MFKTINDCKNLFWFCDQYADMVNILLGFAKTKSIKDRTKIEEYNEIPKKSRAIKRNPRLIIPLK